MEETCKQHQASVVFIKMGTTPNLTENERSLQCRRVTEERKKNLPKSSGIRLLSLSFATFTKTNTQSH
jgi:hypothetical protein